MNVYEVISICILTIIACVGVVYGATVFIGWKKRKRDLMGLSVEYYKRVLFKPSDRVCESKTRDGQNTENAKNWRR